MLRLIVGLLFLLPTAALADPAGQAQGVDPQAEARAAQTRTLVVGADIFIGDRIVTGPSGQVQILFADNTRLVVGPRSALLIQDYLLREDGSAGRMVLDALGGTYRFVTGSAPKDRYRINTPGGTISVRGTAFELWVGGGLAYALVQHGIICSGNECADNVCEVLKVAGGEGEVMGSTGDFSGKERAQLKEWFKYAVNQSSLMGKYRLPGGLDCLRRSPPTGGTPSTIEQGPGDGRREEDQFPCSPWPECG
jgi:hypothetical protein